MSLRRSCVVVLLLAVLGPGLRPLVAFAAAPDHGCGDHVCECVRRCTPKRSAGSACHGGTPSRTDGSMRGTCRHDQTPVTSLAMPVYTAPEAVTPEAILAAESPELTPEAPSLVGFSRVDPRPPRTV